MHTPAARRRGGGGFFVLELRAVFVVMALVFGVTPVAVVKMARAARESVARSELKAALPAIESYHLELGTYAGLSSDVLRAVYDSTLAPGLSFGWASGSSYCVALAAGGHTAHVIGPSGSPESGGCPDAPPG